MLLKDSSVRFSGTSGYVFVVIAATLWASSGSFSKYLFNTGVITPFDLVQSRITLASLFLFLILLSTDRSKLRVAPGSAGYFLWLGCVGMATVQFTYLFAISKINVAAAILIQYLAPALIAAYYIASGKGYVNKVTLCAILMSITGCFFVVTGKKLGLGAMDRIGVMSALCSAVSFAFYSVKSEEGMKRYDASTVLFYSLVFAAIAWNVFRFPFSWVKPGMDFRIWCSLFYIAFLGTVVPFLLYFWGIKIIRSARACITGTLEPVVAGLISWVLVGESMDYVQMTGGVIVIMSVILLQLKPEPATSAHDLVSPEP